jgi:Carboxypeptidase regulatory-like domain/TonB-dependent Receptor Plug Domain
MLNVLADVLEASSKSHRNLLSGAAAFGSPDARPRANRWRSITSLMTAILLFLGMAGLSARGNAQVRFGSVVGTVSDPSGATLSGATVKLTSLGTNESRTIQTGSSGTYVFPNLNAGLYRVEVEMAGFKHFTQDKVEVQVDVTTRVDAALQVGSATESVVVTTEVPPLQTDNASLGTVISQQEVESIPLSGRNVNNMLTLVPGVVAEGGTYGNAVSNQAGGARTNAIGFGNYAIGGGFGNQSSFYVDGVPSNAPANNLNSYIPSQDVVQEFRVVTNNVAAEYGNYAGGVVNITTKSGTNNFHGTAYEYLRNKVLDANDYFSNLNKLARVPLIQNQFGASLGGPIRKDKTFFFFGFEREVLRTGTLVTSTVPTAAELSGDFSAPGLPPIYDQSRPGNPQFQCNGVLNVICPNRLDASAVNLFKASYPLPNVSGSLTQNYIVQEATGGVNNQYNARVDHRFSDKNNLFARYTYWKADSNAYDAWGTHTQGQGPTGIYTHEAILGDTHAFNSSTILDLRLAFLRVFEHEFPDSHNVDLSQFGSGWAAIAGQLPAPANLPAMSFSGDSQGVSGSNGIGSQLFWHQNVYTLSGTLTKLVSRHQLKFGGMGRRVQWISDPENGVLTLNFNNLATAQSANAGGSSIASALLGIPASTTVAPGIIGGSRAYFTAYGFFLDDTFQASKKLTLTAGLRWDQPGVYSEANNYDTVFRPNQPSPLGSFLNPVTGQTQPIMGNVALVGTSAWPSHREDNLHWKLFSPRIGLAYRTSETTVLRAAYGISYPPQTLAQDGPNLSPINLSPTSVTNTFQVQTGQPNSIVATTDNPYPFGLNQPLRRNAPPSFFYGQSTFAMRVPGDPTPYVQQWNAAVERQIGKDSSLTVAYAGSRGTHLLLQGWATVSNIGLNQLPDQYFSLGPSFLQTQIPNPFFGIITTPGSPLSAPTIARGQLLRPFPQFDRVLALDPHKGRSNYRSLQTSYMKRFGSNGILSVAYTWSRLMSDTDSVTAFLDEGFIFGGSQQDNNHLDREYSLSSYDIPHNLAIGYGVDLPFGRGKHFMGDARGVLNGIVSGWRLNGITNIRSGVPISAYQIFAGSALSQFGGGQGYFGAGGLWMRPDVVSGCDMNASGSREYRATHAWFNTSCFVPVDTTSVVRFGNEPRNIGNVRMDTMDNWDISIAKRTAITEQAYLQFTAEFFNAFNHPRFGAPDNNVGVLPAILNAHFGIVTTQANPPRAIQFGLRVGF